LPPSAICATSEEARQKDMIDALRGGVRDALPEGNALAPYLPRVHAARL